MRAVRAFAPASIGNVSVGFDVLGAALAPTDGRALGDAVVARPAEQATLTRTGPFAHLLPDDLSADLVWRAWEGFGAALAREGREAQPLALTLEKNLPVGSGLGSSACSIVAACVAINEAHRPRGGAPPLGEAALLRLMAELEGGVSGSPHYDNVAPAFLGGLQLLLDEGDRVCCALPSPDWTLVLTHPGISISTKAAREVLPSTYPKATAIEHGRRVGGFVHACHAGDAALAAQMMVDVLAEPARAPLLPYLGALRAASADAGAAATGVSGSGPSVFSVCLDEQTAARVAQAHARFHQSPIAFTCVCRIGAGARIEELTA